MNVSLMVLYVCVSDDLFIYNFQDLENEAYIEREAVMGRFVVMWKGLCKGNVSTM